MEEHFPKRVHSAKEHTRAPCFQPYYQCGERASQPQRGCNGYFLPTPMTHYSDEALLMQDAHCPLCRVIFQWNFFDAKIQVLEWIPYMHFPSHWETWTWSFIWGWSSLGCFPNIFPNLGFWNWKTFVLKPCSYTIWTLFEALHTNIHNLIWMVISHNIFLWHIQIGYEQYGTYVMHNVEYGSHFVN